jgi:hypothetical protein
VRMSDARSPDASNNTRMPEARTSDVRTRGRSLLLPRQQRQLPSPDQRWRLPSPRWQRLLHPPPTLVSILHGGGGSLLLRIDGGSSILHGYLHRWRPPRPPRARPPPTPRLHPPWWRNHPAHDLDPASRPRPGGATHLVTQSRPGGLDLGPTGLDMSSGIFLFLKINFLYLSTPAGTKYA